MAIVDFGGFENGNSSGHYGNGTYSFQGTIKRTGDYALRCNPTTTAIGWIGSNTSVNLTDAYCIFNFYYATKPSSNSEVIAIARNTSNAMRLELRINSDGTLSIYNSSATLVATGATVLSADTWYRIGLRSQNGNPGNYEVTINGTSEISGTCNQGTVNIQNFMFGKYTNRNSNTVDFYYDDFCISDSAFPAVGQCFRMDPDGNGTYTAWTGDYTAVDEVPHDSDTTYISTSTNNDVETVTLESATAAGLVGSPLAVKSLVIARSLDDYDGDTFIARLRSGSTDDDGASQTIQNSYQNISKVYDTDPADAGEWTSGDLDALEVGVKYSVLAGGGGRCTALYVMVWEDGVAAGGGEEVVVGWKTLLGAGI